MSNWEIKFDKKFVLTEYDYKLMEERGVLGGIEQIKKLKNFIKEEIKESYTNGYRDGKNDQPFGINL